MQKPEHPAEEPRCVPARAVATPRREVDWNVTIIAAGSFLLHFGAFSSLYSEWADPIVDDGLTIERLVEATRELPTAPEPAVEQAEAAPEGSKPAETAGAAVTSAPNRRSEGGTLPRGGSAPASADASAAGISAELDRMNAEMLATLNASGPATDRVLRDRVLPLADLDAVTNRAAAYKSGLSFESGRTLVPGESSRGLSDLGKPGGRDVSSSPGSARPTQGPRGSVGPIGTGDLPPSDVPNAARVIGGLQGMFRRCYQNGLDREDPGMSGAVRVTARIGPNGEVTSVSATPSGSVTSTVASCIASKVQGAQFDKPTNGQGAVLVVPVGLRNQ
jgi:hypothetical protein